MTSLPDVSELAGATLDAWRSWFVDAAALACARVAASSVAVFYQTDIQHDGRWIDKGHLIAVGAERAGASCLFHKVVCRVPPGATSWGRPGYAHWLAFSRERRIDRAKASADVLPELGEMTWSRAMGAAACAATCRFLLRSTACRVVVDPFCGVGTMLAAANEHGLDAIGVELVARRASRARRLVLNGPGASP